MKKILKVSSLLALTLFILSFTCHKFYVGIYQINYAPEKKMLQITARVFVNDLNDILKKKYHTTTHLGEKSTTPEDLALLKRYFAEQFSLKVDGKEKAVEFLSTEMDNNILICYLKATDVSKLTSLEVKNKILFDLVTEQQNIIQTNIYGKKGTMLLTSDVPSGILECKP